MKPYLFEIRAGDRVGHLVFVGAAQKNFGDLLHFATSNVRFDKKAVQTLFCSESQDPALPAKTSPS